MDINTVEIVRWDVTGAAPFADGAASPLPTGFKRLDAMLDGGLRPGDLYRLSGPNQHKTRCALEVVRCVALGEDNNGQPLSGGHDRPHPVCVFVVDLFADLIEWRYGLLSRCAQVAVTAPKCYNVADLIFANADTIIEMEDMRTRARNIKMRHVVELVFVDLHQLVHSGSASHGRQAEVSHIFAQCAEMARELSLPVVLMT